MGLHKRLKMYIRDDRPMKLKSFVASHDIDVKKVNLSHGRSLLHYCAEFGSPEMLGYLLTLHCDLSKQDNAGRLPLHTALYRALNEDKRTARETYVEVVCPLLDTYPIGCDVEDLNRQTGHDLLTSLKHRLRSDKETEKKRLEKEEEEKEEIEWQKKLSQECEFEMEEEQSRYNFVNDYSEEETLETYSDWSDRMYREFITKQRSDNPSYPQSHPRKRRMHSREPFGPSSNKASRSRSQPEKDEKLHDAREEMRKRYKPPPVESTNDRLLDRKKMYESKFSRFSLHVPFGSKPVTFGIVPWPCINLDQLIDTLFCDLKNKESPEYKKYLRLQKVRWHPDKFSQKFRNHLHPDHVDKIMARVNAISKTLNAFSSR